MTKLLIGGPIRQEAPVLEQYLRSLSELNTQGFHVSYCFVDDNVEPTASKLLKEFVRERQGMILPGHGSGSQYSRQGATHEWPDEAMLRVGAYKDHIIQQAMAEGYDALLFVDSDLVMHPQTLQQLWASEKVIISELFWTRWSPDGPELPQVWQSGQYDLTQGFVEQLRWYGVFPVGGLGACTLIRRRALEAGVRFAPVPGLALRGEDRHFCTRAINLGLDLHVDTHYPAYHIYRDTDLPGVAAYREGYVTAEMKVQIATAVKRTLEEWGTTDWRSMTGLEGLDGLVTELRTAELDRQEAKVQSARDGETITRTIVSGLHVEAFDQAQGTAQVVAALVNEGVDQGKAFTDQYLAEVLVVREEAEWLIAGVNFSPVDDVETAPAVEPELSVKEQAQFLISQGKTSEAWDLLMTDPASLRQEPDRLSMLAVILILENRHDEAWKFLTDVLSVYSEHPDLLFNLAYLCELRQEHRKALRLYRLVQKFHLPHVPRDVAEAIDRVSQAMTSARSETDMRQKISLIYNSHSGSNSIALHKLTPEQLRQRYELDLVPFSMDFETRLRTLDSDLVITTDGHFPLDADQPNFDLFHGFALKGMGLMDKQADHATFGAQWRHTDKIASYSQLFTTMMNACIGKTINHYAVTGAPRNDFLFSTDGRANLAKVLGEDLGTRRVVLFMPTFRFRSGTWDGQESLANFSAIGLDSQGFYDFLEEQDLLFVFKLHPFEEAHFLPFLRDQKRVRFLRDDALAAHHTDLYELLNGVDVLMTDYSSVYIDFLLLDRPVLFSIPDLVEYQTKRGFLLEPYDRWTPGPKVRDLAEFLRELLLCLQEPGYYGDERRLVADLAHQYQDGGSTERVWRVIEQMLAKN